MAAALPLAASLLPVAVAAGAVGGALPKGPGREVFARVCTPCHAIGLVLASPREPDEWAQTLDKMSKFGVRMNASERAAIHGYLSAVLTPESPGFRTPGANATTNATTSASASNEPPHHYPRPTGTNQWPAYGGGPTGQNFSTLTQITPENVASLKQAWVFHTGQGRLDVGDEGPNSRFETTPLLIGGTMYVSWPTTRSTPDFRSGIAALKPETGEVIWRFEAPLNIHGRGLAYWPGDEKTNPRLIFATDRGMIMAVDVTTGRLAKDFGRNGQVDAYIGVSSEIVGDSRRATWSVPNPVMVYRDLFITGARPQEVGPPQPRGDIRAWDARTGRLVWSFHTVPQPGEANHETYRGDEWREVSGANTWSAMALDEAHGIVYAPAGDLNSNAAGPQLYANSLLALDAATGRLLWYRQITHRDVWDYDLSTPPVLMDLQRDGKTIPAILQTSKHGLVFLFNRLTGAPINGYEERPISRTDPSLEGEAWPTEPFPRSPGPIARTQMSRDEIPDLAPGMKAACTDFWDRNGIVSEPLYGARRNTRHATLTYPGIAGGPNWGGGAWYPAGSLYIIGLSNTPVYNDRANGGGRVEALNREEHEAPSGRSATPFSFRLANGAVLSCGAPPYGELVAVDLDRERIAWRTTLGSLPALGPVAGAKVGTAVNGGTVVTASGVVFIGGTNDQRFRAFDARTGRQLWETGLEASAHSTPVTYLGADGKQYVVIVAAGGTPTGGPLRADAIVAYTLK